MKETVECLECGQDFKVITPQHLKTHGMTVVEYLVKYPGVNLTSEATRQRKREVMLESDIGEKLRQYHIDNPKVLERVTIICETCGEPFEVHPYRKDEAKYCSKKCMILRNGEKTTNVCETCGKSFEAYPYEKDRKYCSSECFYVKNGGKATIICEVCGKSFEVDAYRKDTAKFCSMECFLLRSPRVTITCEICGIEFEVDNHQKDTARFCSSKCANIWQSKFRVGENGANWQGGISFEPYCQEFNEKLKRQVRDRYNNCDFMSGLPADICNVVNGKVWKLSIHHIDYNKQQGCSGHAWKLIPVSAKNNSMFNGNRPFWERLICYALEYDETYYDEEIIDIFYKLRSS